jgi:putative ABC transport system permease protein
LREHTEVFEAIAAVSPGRAPLLEPGAEPQQIRVMGVTPNLFSVLGARVAMGRDFMESDGTPQPPPPQGAVGPGAAAQAGAAPQSPPLPTYAILSHAFWQSRFGGDRNVLGRSLQVGGGSVEVVGVLEPGVDLLFPPSASVDREPDLWTAMRVNYEAGSRINVFLRVIAKLKPGVPVERAQAQLDALSAELRNQFPIKQTAGVYLRAEPMHKDLVADVQPAILALMGAVLFVLLIACMNVANLLLVRASSRERELAVRAALGGSRWRLVRQMLFESLLLAAAGGAAGVLLAQFGIDLLTLIRPANLPRLEAVTLSPLVLVFAALAALVSAAAFGVLPALRASRPDVAAILRESGRTPGLRAGRALRNAVVIAEVALSFVLLIGSGLMVRSFIELQRTEPGYDANGLLTLNLTTPPGPPELRAAFKNQLGEALAALPGVSAVTASSAIPLDGSNPLVRWGAESALADPNQFQQGTLYVVLPGYFSTLRTRLLAGRDFTEVDNRPDATVAIIDERLAARAFPNEPAVGRRILVRFRSDEPEWLEVIGVVEHQRHTSLAADGRETLYVVDGMTNYFGASRWIVRTEGDAARLAQPVKAEILRLEPRAVIAEMQPLSTLVEQARTPTRFALVLIGVFAAIAVLLAAVGLYGVLSTVVRQRTSEIGVRMAFGAPRESIFRLVVGHGLRLSLSGIGIGLVAAMALTRVMTSMLIGIEPTDPATFASIGVLFFAIAAFACWLPARRAAALNPTAALREE